MWTDSLLLVASLDRKVHAVRLEGGTPRVVWDEGQKHGIGVSPVPLGARILVAEAGPEGRLVALDRATGREGWQLEVGDVAAAPLEADERLYVVTATGLVAAVSPTGREVWRTELETNLVAPPARVGGALLVAAADGTLFALDPASGAVEERANPDAGPIWGAPALLDDDHAVYATLDGQVFAVTEDLAVEARRSFPSRFFAGPRRDGDTLILAGHEGTIWSYGWEDSEIRWQREVPGAVRAAPAIGPRAISVGDLGGTLYQLDRSTGEILWHTRLDGAITASPLLRGTEVIVATESGTVYAFRPTTPASR